MRPFSTIITASAWRRGISTAVIAFALAVVLVGTGHADPGINTSADNVAINGYDTVAYFVDGKATKGSPEHEVRWQDARWFFANAEHKAVFEADPSRYAPQFGGWCAAGVAVGEYYEVDAETWTIVDGKLYLNYDRTVADTWSSDREGRIAKAADVWTSAAGGR